MSRLFKIGTYVSFVPMLLAILDACKHPEPVTLKISSA
jgi:hypothetical protein